MSDEVSVLALRVWPRHRQPECFYALKMPAQLLLKMAYVPVRKPGTRRGIQRITDEKRLRDIAKYIGREKAMFPNSIIVNFESNVGVAPADELPDLYWLSIPVAPETACVIDGQHRLLGIQRSGIDLEILVTAFLNIPEERKAAIFRDINFYQRKVNKSHMYDLFHVAKDADYPLMRAVDLTEGLNSDGPLTGMVKMTGVGPGVVTQTIFIESLGVFLREGGVFREAEYDTEDSFRTQLQVVKDFYESLRGHYRHVWEEPKSYVLLKTQGVYASIMLLQDVLLFFLQQRDRRVPKTRDFEPFAAQLASKITFASQDYGDAYLGSTGQRRLHQLLRETAEPAFRAK